jgi:hypothetical protein
MKTNRGILIAGFALMVGPLCFADTVIGPTSTFYPSQSVFTPFNSTSCVTPDATCAAIFANSPGSHAYIALQGFNTALGTLDSVTLSFSGATNGDITITNSTGSTMAVNGTYGLSMYLLAPQTTIPTGGTYTASDASNAILSVSPTLASIGGGLGGTSPVTFNTGSTSTPAVGGYATTGVINVPSSLFTEFEGGTLYLPIFTLGTSNLSISAANSNYGIVSTSTQVAGLSVTYSYAAPTSATPEPTTMVLFGSALVGLGLLRKRVRQS